MSKSKRHFILFRDIPLMYGRVPKVANTSIKYSLCKLLSRRPDRGVKSTSDRFWRDNTHGETRLVTTPQARRLSRTHFCFSFVRNPFDRLVAAYNNKILEIKDVPIPMKRMGLHHGMSFASFIQIICNEDPFIIDNHLRPQAEMLITSNKIVPNFVGRMEHMNFHWQCLKIRMKLEGLPTLGPLPTKNVRRRGRNDIRDLFQSRALVDKVLEHYNQDFENFYADYSVEDLLDGDNLQRLLPMQCNSTRRQHFRLKRWIA